MDQNPKFWFFRGHHLKGRNVRSRLALALYNVFDDCDVGVGPLFNAPVDFLEEHEIPWDELAFPVVRDTLAHYFSDRASGHYPVRVGDIRVSRRR